jgi:serine protease Do
MPLVEAVYEKAGDSVVGIRATTSVQGFFGGSQEASSDGSGVIYTADGYIITNYHVVEKVVKSNNRNSIVEVYLNSDPDTPIDAKIIGYNMSADLAVLKIEKAGLVPIDMGDSDGVKVGQPAIAIGCPGGLEFMGSVSYGIISGLNRTITIDAIGDMELIQTDAAINPGNSGGALLNSKGQLIGINSSKLVDTSYEGMGFAIPVNTVVEVVKEIMDNKDKPSPYIGIEIYTYPSSYLEKYNLPHGAAVKSVVQGGPAASSGIRAGDIITQFNSVNIEEYTDFINALEDCTPGTKVTAKIYRNGRSYTTTVTIGSNNSR